MTTRPTTLDHANATEPSPAAARTMRAALLGTRATTFDAEEHVLPELPLQLRRRDGERPRESDADGEDPDRVGRGAEPRATTPGAPPRSP